MRLNSILMMGKRCARPKLEKYTKRLWRSSGSFLEIDRLCVPDQLLKENQSNPLISAENMLRSDRYENALKSELEIGLCHHEVLELEKKKSDRLSQYGRFFNDTRVHPSNQSFLKFSNKRRFGKGLDQASLLTNTFIFLQTPPGFNKVFEQIENNFLNISDSSTLNWLDNLQYAVERSILHAHKWHTDETKLPRRFNPNLPIWKHKMELGIEPEQATRFLFQNLFRIMDFEAFKFIKYANLNENQNIQTFRSNHQLPPRWTTYDRFLETFYFYGNENDSNSNKFECGERINFSELQDLVVFGRDYLEPFISNLDQIRSLSIKCQLPVQNLGPMSALIDLTNSNYYRDESVDGWLGPNNRLYSHPHLFTINLSLPNMWSDFLEPEADPVTVHQRQAAALMHCYASAVAHARSHNLIQPSGELERPVCVQGICSDGVYFDFVTLQLNTLIVPNLQLSKLNKTSQQLVKNFAWIDGHHNLFTKHVPKRSMLRNTKYEDLNMNVFYRLALYYVWSLLDHKQYISQQDLEFYH